MKRVRERDVYSYWAVVDGLTCTPPFLPQLIPRRIKLQYNRPPSLDARRHVNEVVQEVLSRGGLDDALGSC